MESLSVGMTQLIETGRRRAVRRGGKDDSGPKARLKAGSPAGLPDPRRQAGCFVPVKWPISPVAGYQPAPLLMWRRRPCVAESHRRVSHSRILDALSIRRLPESKPVTITPWLRIASSRL